MDENNNDFMKTILQALPDNFKNGYNNIQTDLIEKSPSPIFSYDITSDDSYSNPNTLAAFYIMKDIKILNEFISYNKSIIKNHENYAIYIDSHHLMEMSYFVFAGACLMSKTLTDNIETANYIVKSAINEYFDYCNGFTFYDKYCYEIDNLIVENLPTNNKDLLNIALEIYKRMKLILKVLPFIPYGIIDDYAKKAIEYFKAQTEESNIINLIYKSIVDSLITPEGDDQNEPK